MGNENKQEGELSFDAQLHGYQEEVAQFERDYQSIREDTRLEPMERATAIVTLIGRMRKVSTKLHTQVEIVSDEQKEPFTKVLAEMQQLKMAMIDQVP